MLKRAITTGVSLLVTLGLTGAPAQATEDGKGGRVTAVAHGPKPPKSTKNDVTLTKPTFPKDNHGIPPKPPKPGSPQILTGSSRDYGVGSLGLSNTGMDGTVYMGNPWMTVADANGTGLAPHSLAELSVSSDSNANTIEVGWIKTTGQSYSKFFVSAWTAAAGWLGYGTSFTLYAGRTYSPGDDVPLAEQGTGKDFTIQYDGTTLCGGSGTGAWWLGYNSTWIGYYCENVWAAGTGLRQGTSDFAQAFHEQAYDTTRGFFCSDMGNGKQGSGGSGVGAAYFASLRLFGQATTNPPTDFYVRTVPSTATHFTVSKTSNRTFYSGGPGKDSTGTGVGTTGSC